MRIDRGLCITILLILTALARLNAQESITQETNAPSVKWYQINTPGFQLLYPAGFEAQAQRMANTFEKIRDPEASTMGGRPKKISIILQSQSAVSNGFVTLAPRRSEFYAMPPQNYNFLGNNDWLNLLASHEYRHVAQYQKSITGFNKFLYVLAGQQAVAGLAYVAAPQWFWEGDAVATETAFTQSGRGRIPNFNLLFRTNFLEGRTFNYHKQYLRSYKHNIPNHYVLGYYMISYLRKKTGDPGIWEKIAGRAWSIPFVPFTFSNAIKKETGLYVKDLFKEMAKDFTATWRQELDSIQLTGFETFNSRPHEAYTDYLYPQVLDDGSVLVQKSGIGDIEQLTVLKDGREKKMYVQGPMNATGMMSVANQRVVWNEYRFDPRWLVRTYSVIKGYDFATGKATIVSRHSRYAAAALSPDGSKVATVETGTDYKTKLVILEYATGSIWKEFGNEPDDFISMPHWTSDGKSIIALASNRVGKTIVRFDVESGDRRDLLPPGNENIGYPVPSGHYIFYNSPFSGVDNIYVLDTQSGNRYQVTSSRYGAYNPAVTADGKTLYYNEQVRNGMDVVRAPVDPRSWRPLEEIKQGRGIYQQLAEQEAHPHLFDSIGTKIYPSSRYHRSSGMINPHSWGPYFTSFTYTQAQFGIYSQDILSTTSINAGYVFDINERTGGWQAAVSYQGQYPILDVSVGESDRSVDKGTIPYRKVVGKDTITTQDFLNFKWKEKTVQAGLRVPLITTVSKYSSGITFSDYVGYTAISNFRNSIDGGGRLLPTTYPQYFYTDYADHGKLLYNHFGVSAYRLLKQSRRDINSKWGQALNIDVFDTPFGGDYAGRQFSVYGLAYLPGLFKHHSLWGYWAYQNSQFEGVDLKTGQGLDNYTFRNQVPLPRGQSVNRFQNFYSMSANYTLPLWYPDIALGPVLNIQRVRGNAFADYGYGSSIFYAGTASERRSSQEYISVGGEVKFDINVMRMLPQLNVGVRYSVGLTPSVSKFEILIGTINF